MGKENYNHEVYIAKDKHGEYLYIGSGRSGRHRHCNSGTSHCYELNEMYFKGEEIFVQVVNAGLSKEEALAFEHSLVKEYNPRYNKAAVIKEPDDVDFNSIDDVLEYLKKDIVDWNLLKLILLYTQEDKIVKMVTKMLNRRRYKEEVEIDRQEKSKRVKRSRKDK